jgi:DNA-binding CsgD family transcriptional regulator
MEKQDNDALNAPSQVPETVQQSGFGQSSLSPELAMIADLSPRQRDVFEWICEGKLDREIAMILGISYRTVTVHVRAILSKLGVENRTCAALMGARINRGGAEGTEGGQNTYLYVCFAVSEMLWHMQLNQINVLILEIEPSAGLVIRKSTGPLDQTVQWANPAPYDLSIP